MMITKRLLRHKQLRRALQESGVALMEVSVGASLPGPHRHDIVEIVAVRSGSLLHEIGGRQFESVAGSVDIVPPNEVHAYAPQQAATRIYNIVCDPQQCPSWEFSGAQRTWIDRLAGRQARRPAQLHLPLQSDFWSYLDALHQEMQTASAGSLVACRSWYRLILLELARAAEQAITWHGSGAKSGAREDQALQHLRQAIEAHPEKPWCLSQLANELGVSPEQCCRRFRAVYGQSPMAYVGDRRVAAAQMRLLAGATIAASAQQCGFASTTAMYQAFKVRCDCGPREWLRSQTQ